jgi:hypothetical protein
VQLHICTQTAEVTDALCKPTKHPAKLDSSPSSSARGPSTKLEVLLESFGEMWHTHAQSGALLASAQAEARSRSRLAVHVSGRVQG